MTKKLYRDDYNKSVGGVCIGLAEYFNLDISIVRAIFLLGALCTKGGFIPLYIILWAVLPKKPFGYANPGVDYTMPPQGDAQFAYEPVRKKSNVAVIGGAILVLVGGGLLLDEFNIIPDIDFSLAWPAVLIVIGLAIIFSSGKKKSNYKDPIDMNANPPIV
jgi:phage shock protein C